MGAHYYYQHCHSSPTQIHSCSGQVHTLSLFSLCEVYTCTCTCSLCHMTFITCPRLDSWHLASQKRQNSDIIHVFTIKVTCRLTCMLAKGRMYMQFSKGEELLIMTALFGHLLIMKCPITSVHNGLVQL